MNDDRDGYMIHFFGVIILGGCRRLLYSPPLSGKRARLTHTFLEIIKHYRNIAD